MVRTWWRWRFGAMLAVGLALGCARQAVPEYPPLASSERKASTSEAPVRVLEQRSEYRFDEQGNWEERWTQKYRILNRDGVDSWGYVSASWAPWYMARPQISAQVEDPGGAVRELDMKSMAESAAYPDVPDVYGDRRVLRAPLPGVQVGSVVTETIVLKTTRPFFPGGDTFQVDFQGGIPRDKVELVVDLPEKMPFRYDLRDLLVMHEETLKNGRRRVRFHGENYAGVEPVDSFSPSNVAEWPSVVFSTGASWQDIARAYEKLMDEKLKGAAGVAELARRSVTPKASPIEQANQLLLALHERVRYAAIEFGQAAIVPTTPAETLTRTYGDCKDQALALVAMLRAVGLPATLALLRAGPGEDVHPRMPALNVFDHAIVVVRGDEPFWIDPTSDYARAGEVPLGDQGRLALIIDGGTKDLSLIPTMSASQNTYLETREIRLQEAGPAHITETSTSTGLMEQRTRGSFAASEEQRKKDLLEYVKSFYRADKLVSSKFEGFEDTRKQARLTLEASSSTFGASDLFVSTVPIDQSLLYSYLPGPLLERGEDSSPPRKGDLLIPARYQAEVRYRVVPPPGFKLKKLPDVPAIDLGPAKLLRQYRQATDGSVEATFKLELDKRQLSPRDQAAIRAGLDAIDQEPQDSIEFEHEAVLAFETGQPAAGMKLMREQVQAEPKAVAPLLRWAFKLNDLGFGAAAREKTRAALALEPNSNSVQRSAGFVFARDEQGRYLGAGYERQAAIAAFRRAVELDADDVYSKTELAVLLEYDAEGRRYADPTGVDEAIRVYDTISDEALKSYDEGAYRSNALFALLGVGRYKELRERLSKLKAEDVPLAISLSLEAIEAGAAGALALADRRQLRGEARSQALRVAAATLYEKRQYAVAAALFEEAAKGAAGADSAKYANMARLLRQTVPVEPSQSKQDSPESVVRKALLLVMASEDFSGGAALKSLLSSRVAQDKPRWTPPAGVFVAASSVDDTGVPRPVLVDTAAGMTKLSVEGDDTTGYRVKTTTDGLGDHASVAKYYVVKEGKGYFIRAVDDRGAMGCEALYLLSKHADKPARQWLSWAAEDEGEGVGEDPLRLSAFARLWAAGKGDAELSATALCADSVGGKEARQALLKRRTKAGAQASAIEQAIAASASNDDNYELQLAAAEELLRLHPGSSRARSYQVWALRRLKRYEQYERAQRLAVAEAKSSSFRRTDALLELADLQAQTGKLAESRKTLQQVIDDGQAFDRARAYNNAAWNGLFLEQRPKNIEEQAVQAVQLSRSDKYSAVHTLACIYLDQGKIADAQRTFDQLLELDKIGKLRDGTRYVLGGLAEAYGMLDEARRAYESLEAPKEPSPTATYWLAQRRLKALDKARKVN